MTNPIQTTAVSAWTSGRKTRRDSKGWISGNAVCCPHNGETTDTRGRGGMIANADGTVSYSCFNCSYKTSYTPGYPLYHKFRKLLRWLNVDEAEIQRLNIEAKREQQRQELLGLVKIEHKKEEVKVDFKKEPLPDEAVSFTGMIDFFILADECIDEHQPPPEHYKPMPQGFRESVEYVYDRKIDMQKYDFYWTTDTKNKMNKRVIIPFTWKNEIIGFTARALNDDITPKYIQHISEGYVFNIDKQQKDWKVVIVCEGVFDAISIDAVAVLRSDITKSQIDIIESLDREIIVVPDFDKSGGRLVDIAIQNGWSVSFPVWAETCKDVNQAVQKYGKLFTLKTIVDAVESNPLKIKLLRKKYV